MNQIKSYLRLYLKIMLKDKVPLLWTIGLPLGIALLYGPREELNQSDFLLFISFFWVYIILSIYLNGIGLQLSRMREHGLMKTYIMISGNKFTFVIAVIMAQVIFAFVSLVVFTSVVTIIYGYLSVEMLLMPILLLIASLPFAIASTVITLLPIKISSMSTLANILLFPLFLLARELPDHFLSYLNPFFALEQNALWIINVVTSLDIKFNIALTLIATLIYFVIGFVSIKKLNLVSLVTR